MNAIYLLRHLDCIVGVLFCYLHDDLCLFFYKYPACVGYDN